MVVKSPGALVSLTVKDLTSLWVTVSVVDDVVYDVTLLSWFSRLHQTVFNVLDVEWSSP